VTEHKRILIADDDPRVLLILRDVLLRMDRSYKIISTQNGREALQEIKEDTIDLLITDVRMPGIDGIELTKAIRTLNLETAVVWITAYGCGALKTECEQLEVHRCLDKPLRIGEIRQAVRDALMTGIDQLNGEKR
jgi:DNA-binding NtrC family response regulator